MAKYIDAEAAKRMAVETVVSTMPDVAELLEKAIDNIPAADVAPVVHAHWIDTGFCGPHHMMIVQCSACKKESEGSMADMYCPNCGAKMDGEATP